MPSPSIGGIHLPSKAVRCRGSYSFYMYFNYDFLLHVANRPDQTSGFAASWSGSALFLYVPFYGMTGAYGLIQWFTMGDHTFYSIPGNHRECILPGNQTTSYIKDTCTHISRTAKTLIRLGSETINPYLPSGICHRRCPGWSESSLGAQSFDWFCH